jgi:uncharacterized membrane protein YjgN (DUF898 family)
MSEGTTLTAAPIGTQQFVYSGRLGEIYRIFIINLLLGIVTLSIYRFWGKTNMRRYIWSSMSLQGQSFEYTGTGGELFKGFLMVFGFYLAFYLATVVIILLAGYEWQIVAQYSLILAVVYLTFVAQYAAQRYRLTRTLWSGMRGGMTGSAWVYGIKALFFTALSPLTLGLAGPWMQMRLTEDRFNNAYFGDGQATLAGRARPLMGSYILGYALFFLGAGAVVAGIGVLLKGLGVLEILIEMMSSQFEGRAPNYENVDLSNLKNFSLYVGFSIFAIYLGLAFVGVAAFAPYAAAFFRELARGLGFAGLTFKSRVGARDFMALWIGNFALLIFTLGLGLPVVIHRSVTFFANRLEIHGMIDVDRLRQNTLQRPRTGEGLLEVFDPGFL